jgi:two-component system sensor histidine kinase/response regulator
MKSPRVGHRVRDPAEGSKNIESKILESTIIQSKISVLVPQAVAAPISSVKVSWDRTEALERLSGDKDLLRELCEIFLEESPKLLQRLRQALAESNANAVMRAAHSLKGELGYLGAAGACQAARALEDMGRDQNFSRVPEMLVVLERELAGLHLAMKDSAGAMQ